MQDSNAAIDAIVADIDAAKAHVHLLFYFIVMAFAGWVNRHLQASIG